MGARIVVITGRGLSFTLATDAEVPSSAWVAVITAAGLERIHATIFGMAIVDRTGVVVVAIFDDIRDAHTVAVTHTAICAHISVVTLNVRGDLVGTTDTEDAAVDGARVLIITFVRLTRHTHRQKARVTRGADLAVVTRLILKREVLTQPLIAAISRAVIAIITGITLSRDARTATAMIATGTLAPIGAWKGVVIGVDALPRAGNAVVQGAGVLIITRSGLTRAHTTEAEVI